MDFAAQLAAIQANIDAYTERQLVATREVADDWKEDAAAHMKADAPWTDQTGNARADLDAVSAHPADLHDGAAVVLTQQVPYGVYLEGFKPDGTAKLDQLGLEVIMPTVVKDGPQLVENLRKVWH